MREPRKGGPFEGPAAAGPARRGLSGLRVRGRRLPAALLAAASLVGPGGGGCRRSLGPEPAIALLAERGAEGLDPHTAGQVIQTWSLLSNAYEGLVALDAQLAVTPALAVSWTNPDALTWDFRLRPGVRFHDGSLLDADDVVFSFRRARDHPRSTRRDALAGVSVEKVGALEVRLRTLSPDAFLLPLLREVAVVSRRFVEREGAGALAARSAGTGPYRIVRVRAGPVVELERFDPYWGPRPAFRRAYHVGRSWGDPEVPSLVPRGTRLVFFARPGTERYREAEKVAVPSAVPGLSVAYLGFDLHGAATPRVTLPGGEGRNPFLDRRVRRAVALAVDPARFLSEARGGRGFLPTQMVPALVFGFDPSVPSPRRDLARARALLSEAGLAGGVEAEVDVRSVMEAYARRVAEDLGAVGWRVRVNSLPEEEFFERLASGGSSLYVLRFWCRSGDAQEILDRWVRSRDAARGLGTANFSYERCPVPGLDERIDAARRTLEPSARLGLLQEAMRRVSEEVLAVPLFIEEHVTFLPRGVAWPARADAVRLFADARPSVP